MVTVMEAIVYTMACHNYQSENISGDYDGDHDGDQSKKNIFFYFVLFYFFIKMLHIYLKQSNNIYIVQQFYSNRELCIHYYCRFQVKCRHNSLFCLFKKSLCS